MRGRARVLGPGAAASPCPGPTRAAAPLRPLSSIPASACAPADLAPEDSAPAYPHGAPPSPAGPRRPPPQSGPYLRVAATPPAPRHARAIVSLPSARGDPPDPRSAALRLLRASLACPPPPLFSRRWQPPSLLRRTPLRSAYFFRPTPASSRRHRRPAFPPLFKGLIPCAFRVAPRELADRRSRRRG